MAENWVAQAVRLWADKIGLIPHGRMGRALQPAVELYGPDLVLAWLKVYLDVAPLQKKDGALATEWDGPTVKAGNARWLTPESFVRTIAVWRDLAAPAEDL